MTEIEEEDGYIIKKEKLYKLIIHNNGIEWAKISSDFIELEQMAIEEAKNGKECEIWAMVSTYE